MNKTQKAMVATDKAEPAPVEDKAAAYRPNAPKEPSLVEAEAQVERSLQEMGYSPSGGLVKKFFTKNDVERMQKFEQDFSVFLTALNDMELLLTNRLSEVHDMQKALKVFQR